MPVTLRRWDGIDIITYDDVETEREAVIKATRAGISLYRADLSGSDLSGSDLSGSNLSGSDLTPIRDDLYAVLSHAPAEASALIEALAAGRVNGSTYSDGECGCLVGTLAIAAGADPKSSSCESVHGLRGNGSRPIERFFLSIKKGDTPDTSQFAQLAHEWATEWVGRMQAAFGVREAVA